MGSALKLLLLLMVTVTVEGSSQRFGEWSKAFIRVGGRNVNQREQAMRRCMETVLLQELTGNLLKSLDTYQDHCLVILQNAIVYYSILHPKARAVF